MTPPTTYAVDRDWLAVAEAPDYFDDCPRCGRASTWIQDDLWAEVAGELACGCIEADCGFQWVAVVIGSEVTS